MLRNAPHLRAKVTNETRFTPTQSAALRTKEGHAEDGRVRGGPHFLHGTEGWMRAHGRDDNLNAAGQRHLGAIVRMQRKRVQSVAAVLLHIRHECQHLHGVYHSTYPTRRACQRVRRC